MTNFTLNLESVKLTDEQFFRLCRDNRDLKFERNEEVQVLDSPQTLSGEDVLPGFILNLDF